MLLNSVGIDPNNISSLKERRLVLLFNNLAKVRKSFSESSQGKLAHLMPIDVYADLYGIQYLTPGVFINRLIPNLLIIPQDFDRRAVKSDDVINWNKKVAPGQYTTDIIGNAGIEKYMMDKIQEHILALQRNLTISLQEIESIKNSIYNDMLGDFAFDDGQGNITFYGQNTAGKAQMEKDILRVAQTGFQGIEGQPSEGLFAPGEFQYVGITANKTKEDTIYYTYKDLTAGKESTDIALFVDEVFKNPRYNNLDEQTLNYKKGVFTAALTIRRFFDLQINNVLFNTVEYLHSSSNILQTLNHDSSNAKVVNGLARKWAKIADEINNYNGDPTHDFTFTPHAWAHEDFESLYKVQRFRQIKAQMLRNIERIKKEGANNQFLVMI